ncbi:MAG: cbb3-type cytochrome c oxidase subunit 3 [Bacteroidia bacterium]|nr:cbb3-type cytochrome c oxidase subunit 3 [Bacteroidia bacterium]
MYKDVLRSISGIDIFPVIAILIFMIFFIGLFVYVLRLDKKEVSEMASLPFDDDTLKTSPSSPYLNGQTLPS